MPTKKIRKTTQYRERERKYTNWWKSMGIQTNTRINEHCTIQEKKKKPKPIGKEATTKQLLQQQQKIMSNKQDGISLRWLHINLPSRKQGTQSSIQLTEQKKKKYDFIVQFWSYKDWRKMEELEKL